MRSPTQKINAVAPRALLFMIAASAIGFSACSRPEPSAPAQRTATPPAPPTADEAKRQAAEEVKRQGAAQGNGEPTAVPKSEPAANPNADPSTAQSKTNEAQPQPEIDPHQIAVWDEYYSGGQPGRVELRGAAALVTGDNAFEKRITVRLSTGIGWRGTRPALYPNRLLLTKATSKSPSLKPPVPQSQDAQATVFGDTYIRLGCDGEEHPELSGLSEAAPVLNVAGVDRYTAKVILLCGEFVHSNARVVSFSAERIILSNASITMAPVTDEPAHLLIETTRLDLRGNNKLLLMGPDDDTISADGPALLVSAKHMIDTGDLDIESRGRSFVAKAAETVSITNRKTETTTVNP